MRATNLRSLCATLCGATLSLTGIAHAASLLVLNKGDSTLAIVDTTTLTVKGRVPSGPDPHEVIASSDGKLAWISNYTQGNTLTPVDVIAIRNLQPIDIGALSRPHGLTFAGGKLYFTVEGSKAIARFDPPTGKIDWVMGTGQNRTHMVIASKDLKQLFTSNVASGSVCILEQTTGAPGRGPGRGPAAPDWAVTVIPVGRGAEGFDLSPDGKELWAANAEDGSVSIIDVASKKVVQTLPVPFLRANRLKFTPDGKHVLISDLGANELFILDAAARKQIKKLDLGGKAAGMQMDPNGTRAFISVGSANGVAVVDLKDWKVLRMVPTGPGPDGLAWAETP